MTKLILDDLEMTLQNFAVLELIPDTHAWVKNPEGRFVFGNQLFYNRFGFDTMAGLIGKTDFDLAPQDMARLYRADDECVLAGGVVTDRLELIIDKAKSVEWFLTRKSAIYNSSGNVIGTFGFSRHLNKSEVKAEPFKDLREPINYINQYFGSRISTASLAKASNISVSALERRFRKHLDKSPHKYLNEVRLDNAYRLLKETQKSMSTIADETGFSDQSHFTRAFGKRFGSSPSKLRRQLSLGEAETLDLDYPDCKSPCYLIAAQQ